MPNLPLTPAADWQDDVFDALARAGVGLVPYLPDAGLANLIRRVEADPAFRGVVLTTEEEGVAISCGAWLGGTKAVLLMQSSGVGNCINMLSLVANCRFPLVMIVTMRGEWAEFNDWQVPMSRAAEPCLKAMGLGVLRVDLADQAGETVAAAIESAFSANQAVAILLSQRLIGRKEWKG